MTRRKRSSKVKRIKRFRKKLSPREINLAFKQRLEPMATDLEMWLTLLDNLEKRVIALCQAQGIPSEELVNYLAYAKKQFNRLDRFSALTLWQEIQIKVGEALLRGLRESKAQEILPILQDLKDQLDFYRECGYWKKVNVIFSLATKLSYSNVPLNKDFLLSTKLSYSNVPLNKDFLLSTKLSYANIPLSKVFLLSTKLSYTSLINRVFLLASKLSYTSLASKDFLILTKLSYTSLSSNDFLLATKISYENIPASKLFLLAESEI
jgi:hypothetical protein